MPKPPHKDKTWRVHPNAVTVTYLGAFTTVNLAAKYGSLLIGIGGLIITLLGSIWVNHGLTKDN